MIQSRPVRALIVALFFATGICGLGYQVLWAKSFATGVGHEFPAVLAVITAFMGGLGLGSFLSDRVRWLQSYGWLEIVIGLWAALTVVLIPATNRGVVRWLGPDPSPSVHWWVVFGSVFVVLLPATIAMGATFPAIQSFLARFDGGKNVGLLYSANTAGAMTGALASAFWLMPRFGIPKSILCLAGVNLICGVTALMLATPARNAPPRPNKSERALDLRVFLTGFLGIGFEIVMIRGLSQVLENTVFTFAALLATYLCATAVGAAIFQRTRRPMDVRWLLGVLATTCLLGGITLRFIPGLYSALRAHLGDSAAGVAFAEVMATAAVLFIPALVMGMTFAWLVEQSLRVRSTLGRSVALNTCGGALAPAFFGLILLPSWGLKGSIALIAAGYAGLIGKSRFAFVLVPFILASSLLLPSGRDLLALEPGERAIFHAEGSLAATSVIESSDGGRVLKVNSRFQMGGTMARIAEERQADIPLLLYPAARSALFIGLGTGITFSAATHYPDLRAEAVELLPEVVNAQTLFSGTNELASGKIHLADGRRFVLSTSATYDVIVADLFHPAQDGAGFLYTREHFSAIANRLNPEGLFCQWLPVFQMDLSTLQTVTRTFLSVFPNAEAWMLRFNVDTPVIGLISRSSGRSITSTNFPPSRPPELAAHLRSVGLPDSVRLFGCFLAGSEQLRTFSSAARVNSDAHPVVMFEAPRLAFQRQDDPAQRLLALLELFDSEVSLPIQEPDVARRVKAFIAARDLYLQALTLEGRGEAAQAAELYLSSVRQSAEFTPAYAQILAIATALAPVNLPAAEHLLRELMDAQPNIPVAGQLLEQLKK